MFIKSYEVLLLLCVHSKLTLKIMRSLCLLVFPARLAEGQRSSDPWCLADQRVYDNWALSCWFPVSRPMSRAHVGNLASAVPDNYEVELRPPAGAPH